jgi:hypothetical protein
MRGVYMKKKWGKHRSNTTNSQVVGFKSEGEDEKRYGYGMEKRQLHSRRTEIL